MMGAFGFQTGHEANGQRNLADYLIVKMIIDLVINSGSFHAKIPISDFFLNKNNRSVTVATAIRLSHTAGLLHQAGVTAHIPETGPGHEAPPHKLRNKWQNKGRGSKATVRQDSDAGSG